MRLRYGGTVTVIAIDLCPRRMKIANTGCGFDGVPMGVTPLYL